MFEYAISRNQRQKPTKRIFASFVVSCLVHTFFLLMLIQFPALLRGGMYHGFRPLSIITGIRGPAAEEEEEEERNWRTVAVLRGPMIAPSAATLKKYLPDWDKKTASSQTIRVRWGDEQKPALENSPPMPRIRQEPELPKLLPPPNERAPAGTQAGNSTGSSAGSSTIAQAGPNPSQKGGMANLPPPDPPPPAAEIARNIPPGKIPDGIKPPSDISQPPEETVKVFENEQKAIQSSESGFFGTKGFPLGEYADIIKERIKGKWFIPSNLKNSQGRTTVVFYIGKDGRYTDARIVSSSGSQSLDLAALKAVMDSNPFPPLPKGFPGDHIGAKFVLSYNEPQ